MKAASRRERTTLEISKLVARLTPNQLEVLTMMASGMSDAEIANGFGISLKGVEWYHTQIFKRLELPYGGEGKARARNAKAIEALRLSKYGVTVQIENVTKARDFKVLIYSNTPEYSDMMRDLIGQGYRREQVVEVFVLRRSPKRKDGAS